MNVYDLVVKTSPPVGGDWSAHHIVLDSVPSAVLVADELTPYFRLTIDAETVANAVLFTTGVFTLFGVAVTDIETALVIGEDLAPVAYDFPEAKIVQAWMAKMPELMASA